MVNTIHICAHTEADLRVINQYVFLMSNIRCSLPLNGKIQIQIDFTEIGLSVILGHDYIKNCFF